MAPLFLIAPAPLAAQPIILSPSFGTELRYEQSTPDRLLDGEDALLFRARPGFSLSTGPWSFDAASDAAITLRRIEPGAAPGTTPHRPEAIQLGEIKVQYSGLPGTAISVGRQHLGLAGAAITGDRDGAQTFDAARLRWTALPGLSADIAYAWSSSSLWAADVGPLPVSVPGENIFAQLSWAGRFGTLSGYTYQIDQREAGNSDFRLLNQVYGARFSGSRKIGEDIRLGYSLGFVRQTGSLANAVGGAPTYWQIGSSFDLGDLAATRTSYRRFAANGISTSNGDKLSLSTSATRGKLSLGATYNDFRPVADPNAIPARDLRVSLGLIF
ncbi:hypothetical protein [Rhizorhabdus dicambivorans]|uniref:hypothetical protein n=1 Tax=Rhizorhabdus dicambivorans TaxID=1850238 RepID=UPI00114204BA|nr:hypothetical protein [Rhizorhabdus dicambivorans]